MSDDLSVRVAVLETTVARLSAVLNAGGPERRLGLPEIAARLGRSHQTLRVWVSDPHLRVRYRVDRYLCRVAGRWSSTPREVEEWQRFLSALGARRRSKAR